MNEAGCDRETEDRSHACDIRSSRSICPTDCSEKLGQSIGAGAANGLADSTDVTKAVAQVTHGRAASYGRQRLKDAKTLTVTRAPIVVQSLRVGDCLRRAIVAIREPAPRYDRSWLVREWTKSGCGCGVSCAGGGTAARAVCTGHMGDWWFRVPAALINQSARVSREA